MVNTTTSLGIRSNIINTIYNIHYDTDENQYFYFRIIRYYISKNIERSHKY